MLAEIRVEFETLSGFFWEIGEECACGWRALHRLFGRLENSSKRFKWEKRKFIVMLA